MGNQASSLEETLRKNAEENDAFAPPKIPPGKEIVMKIGEMLVEGSRVEGVGGDKISREIFQRYFSSAKDMNVADIIFNSLHRRQDNGDKGDKDAISKTTFLKMCEQTQSLVSDTLQLKFYLALFSQDDHTLTKTDVTLFVKSCFLLEWEIRGSRLDCDADSPTSHNVFSSMANASVSKGEIVTVEHVQSWFKKTCPFLHQSVHQWMTRKLTAVQQLAPVRELSRTTSNSSKRFATTDTTKELLHPTVMWVLWKTLPQLYTKQKRLKTPTTPKSPGAMAMSWDPHVIISNLLSFSGIMEWDLLYNSDHHGMSMNRFQHHVFSYRGPTLLIAKTDGDVLLCVGIDHEWRERAQRWGGENCTAIQITPHFKIFEAGEKIIYFNLTTRGYPFGLQIGQSPKSPVLEIDQEMAIASIKKIPYTLEALEVWGCSGSSVKDEQLEQKKWEFKQAERQQRVNLNSVEWEENPDRYILEMGGRPTYSRSFKR